MKYGITFYPNKKGEYDTPIPVNVKKDEITGELWMDSVKTYELEDAYRILDEAGYYFKLVDYDGWHEFNYRGELSVTLVPEVDID